MILKKFNNICQRIISEMVEENSNQTNNKICKYWGYANNCEYDEDFAKKFRAALQEHDQMVKDHPEEHDPKLQESIVGNCLHLYSCKCGFSYKVDSSRIKINNIFKYFKYQNI